MFPMHSIIPGTPRFENSLGGLPIGFENHQPRVEIISLMVPSRGPPCNNFLSGCILGEVIEQERRVLQQIGIGVEPKNPIPEKMKGSKLVKAVKPCGSRRIGSRNGPGELLKHHHMDVWDSLQIGDTIGRKVVTDIINKRRGGFLHNISPTSNPDETTANQVFVGANAHTGEHLTECF